MRNVLRRARELIADWRYRKLLMEVELPSETQQIDRVLQAFADRYHECNPFIYKDSGKAVDQTVGGLKWANLIQTRRITLLFR